MKTVMMKPYRISLFLEPTAARSERCEGNLYALTTFVMGAPEDSPLKQALVDGEHCGAAFPRLRVNIIERYRRGYTLHFFVEEEQDTDKFVEELRAILNKNEWEC